MHLGAFSLFVEVIVSITLSCPVGVAEDCKSEDILATHTLCLISRVLVEGPFGLNSDCVATLTFVVLCFGAPGVLPFHFEITSFLFPLSLGQSL